MINVLGFVFCVLGWRLTAQDFFEPRIARIGRNALLTDSYHNNALLYAKERLGKTYCFVNNEGDVSDLQTDGWERRK